MNENIKDGDLITLKLASGEEVIANYKGGTDSHVSIEKALVLMQGPQGLAFGTWMATAKQDEPINISKDNISIKYFSYCNNLFHDKELLFNWRCICFNYHVFFTICSSLVL